MMRTNRLLYALLALGGMLVCLRGAAADEPAPPPPISNDIPLSIPEDKTAEREFVQDLVSILNETRSSDAFIATVLALHRAGVDGKLVVPAIIKNAERLKLFADTNADQGTPQQKIVMKAMMLLLKKGEKKVHTTRSEAVTGGILGSVGGALIGAAAYPSSNSGGGVNACGSSTPPVPTMPKIPDPLAGELVSPCYDQPR